MKDNIPTILITGANGQLGREFRCLENAYPYYQFLFVSKEELPIDNLSALTDFFKTNQLSYCINCAAYTAVDKAELEIEQAYSINANAAGNLALLCFQYKVQLIHISTDYVFDGNANLPMNESYPVHPLNTYGASKLAGERLVFQNNPQAIIIRTSWVYSSFGNNFVKTMLRLMKERKSIKVVNDQWGCPTYANDLALTILEMLKKCPLNGTEPFLYHYSNAGKISWFEFAETIKVMIGADCEILPITTSEYPTPAKRPSYSVLETSKIKESFSLEIPYWKDSLKKCLEQLDAEVTF